MFPLLSSLSESECNVYCTEDSMQELMEGLNTALLSGCKEERWPLVARVHMLHLLELRSLGWRPSPHTSQYYR